MTDSYEDDEPIEKIREILQRQLDFVTAPPDLRIVIHRENGYWRGVIDGLSEHVAGDGTFDGLCGRLAEGLHLFGLNRERTAITVKGTASTSGMYLSHESATSANPRVFVFQERAS